MKRLAFAFMLLACDFPGPKRPEPREGAITGVAVVLKDSSEPLPFDPRGGRLTIVTSEVARLVGHPIILELDTALSPELKASLEETVLASFETIARELVILQKDDPEMFAAAKSIKRVVCKYDAVAKESEGELAESGKELRVTSPPDRFPLLERGVLLDAVYRAYVAQLDKRWGDVDPASLPASQQEPYFAYMMSTRPGAGYLWIAARASNEKHNWDDLREEHFRRIIKLANVARDPPLVRKIAHFLAENATYASTRPGLHADYAAWLNRNAASLDDADRLLLARAVFERRDEVKIPGFDRFGWGMSLYDAWTLGKVHGDLEKIVVCPTPRRGEAETEIKWSCSAFFASIFADDRDRAALAQAIIKRNEDHRLLELALLNIGHNEGKHAVEFVASFASRKSLFEDGFRLLFHDNARRDDVRGALDDVAPTWWRDYPTERGLTLLVMGRRWEGLHPHYGDNQWTRFQADYGGPVKRDVFVQFLAEGPRAVEMVPKMWGAFAKGTERDDLVAKSLPVLLERDRTARTSRATPVLALLRSRLCIEKNAAGLTAMRSSIEGWANAHPDARAAVSNALADFTLARCPKDPALDPESGGR